MRLGDGDEWKSWIWLSLMKSRPFMLYRVTDMIDDVDTIMQLSLSVRLFVYIYSGWCRS
jgi:hypothetical protein